MPRRVVKNAPYSADMITESTQVLPDGNRIHQSTTVRMYRDSEGRTRSEQSLNSLRGLAPNAHLPQVVFINDPVSNTNLALNPDARTATRTTWQRGQGGAAGAKMRRGPGGGRQPATGETGVKTESLGRQTIEGIPADGTRTTRTIPAGQIGNEQPLQIVTETWYSPDLQMVLLSKRSDPRSGDTVTRLSNISRAEPPRTLFEAPADYKITDGPARQQ